MSLETQNLSFFFLAFKNNIKSEAPGERISEERKSLKK